MSAIDVAIVGAGPAGAWAARALARHGARVSMFDASHPREKPCGGGVTGRALALVEPALAGTRLPMVAISSARFEFEDLETDIPLVDSPTTGPPDLVIARRTDFDGALLDAAVAAGVTHVRERVIDVDAAPDGVTIRTLAGCYHADRVIGADGANSLVRRRVTQPFSRAQLSIATGFFARGASAPAIVVRFETDPPGYLWSFPRPDHLAIGICAPADAVQVAALRSRAAQWIQRANLGQHVTLEPYAWPIPSLGARHWDSEQPAGARWLLVGDAAGLVDPITREGISYALQSAEQAAAAIASSGDSARAYAESVRDTLYPELRLAAALKADFYGQRFLRLMIEALARSGPVRRAMTDLIAGRQQYATLKRRLLATFELALVWRLFRPVPPSRAHHGARPLDLDVDRSPHRRA